MGFDQVLFNAIHRFWGTNRVTAALGVFVANTLTWLMAGGMLAFVFLAAHTARERMLLAGEMLLAFILARGILTTVIGAIVGRVRPFESLGFAPPFVPITAASFPSGHMAGLFAVAFVMLTVDLRWGGIYLALSLLVGVARVFTGLHWPSDILGGMVVGLLSGWMVHYMVRPTREALTAGAAQIMDGEPGGGPPD